MTEGWCHVKIPRKHDRLIFFDFVLKSQNNLIYYWILNLFAFSSNRPTGPIRSSSRVVRLSVCLFDVPFHMVYFEAYFAPTSQNRMSKKILRFGILGEKCWKEVVSELNIFNGMWSKIAAQKKGSFLQILPYKSRQASLWIRDLWLKDISLILAYL